MAAFEPEAFDVSPDRFGDPQPVQRQQADQGVVAGPAETGGDQQRADFVAVQAGGVGLVVQAGPTHMHGG